MATKTIHRLQLPYATPEWPTLSKEDQDNVVNHLVDILTPIGDYRRRHVVPSKGKRRMKRKRDNQEHAGVSSENAAINELQMPSVFDYLVIGFNRIVRSLEALSQRSKPAVLQDADTDMQLTRIEAPKLAAVFVCRSVLPDPIIASIPLLIATASLTHPQDHAIRLVQLPASAESQLAQALHQPRVGFVGVQAGAPEVNVLLTIVRAAVGPVQVPWLDASENPRYLPVQVESTGASTRTKEKPKKSSSEYQSATEKDDLGKSAATKPTTKPKPKSRIHG